MNPSSGNVPTTGDDALARGQTLHRENRFAEALDCFRAAAERTPTNADARFWLGVTLAQLNRLPEAREQLRNATQLRPGMAVAWKILAVSLGADGTNDADAEAAHQRAIALAPNEPTVQCNYGTFLLHRGRLDGAIACFRRAIALAPNYPLAVQNLANALFEIGAHSEALELQRKVVQLAPNDARFGSNLLFNLHYVHGVAPEDIFTAHVEWARRFGQQPQDSRTIDYPNSREPDRKLRIGYLSPDFRRHPLAFFIENILTAHDRSQFEIVAYFNGREGDDITARLRALVDEWREIAVLNDDDAARTIREDRIDILIDLAGHTNGNRAPLLARCAAPVQITYFGYADTTGLPQVNYRITDAVADPPGLTERFNTEKLVRLRSTFLCYRPYADAPPTLPRTPAAEASANGAVTFGSFNNFSKVTDEMLDLWATILEQTPRSRMIFQARALSSDAAQKRVTTTFRRHGIKPARLSFHSWIRPEQRHALLASADVALDPFPYSGTTTTCEMLWLGVPCITLAGSTHVSRVSASILSVIGHAELIADSAQSYVSKAVALASEIARLNSYRTGLREAMTHSPLLDGPGFTKDLERAFRAAWQRWCAGSAAAPK